MTDRQRRALAGLLGGEMPEQVQVVDARGLAFGMV
jgi:hypothetical protein